MRSFFIILGLFFFIPFNLDVLKADDQPAQSPQVLNLKFCIERGLDASRGIKIAADEAKLGDIRVREARRDFLPSVSISMSDNRSINAEEFSYYDPQTGQSYVPGEGYQMDVSFRVPLYTGSRLTSNLRAERFSAVESGLKADAEERNVWFQIVTRYLTCLERRAERDIRKEQVAKANEGLNLARKRLSAGQGIRYETLVEEAYFAKSQYELVKADNLYQDSIRNLLILLRMPIDSVVDLQDIAIPGDVAEPLENLVEEAFRQREDIRVLDNELAGVKCRLTSMKSSKKPSIDFIAQYEKQGSKASEFSEGDNRYVAGLSLRFSPFRDSTLTVGTYRDRIESRDFMHRTIATLDLFDHASTIVSEIELEIAIRDLELQVEEKRDEVIASVLKAAEQLRESMAACRASELDFDATQENYLIQDKSYKLGIVQYKNVIDARTEVTSAQINLNFSRYLYALDFAALDYSLGRRPWKE